MLNIRKGARLLLFAGKRFTGTLTSPNVSVPDQNGRGPFDSSVGSALPFVFLVARLGSAFLLFQRTQALLQYAVQRGCFSLCLHCVQPRRFATCLLFDE